MDKFNVISLTSDLSELQIDMANWSNMPFDLRRRSDENCLRLYRMTNIDLFNTLKASILSKTIPENPELIGNAISEGTISYEKEVSFVYDEDRDYSKKKQMAEQLEQSPSIVIISPTAFRIANPEEYLAKLQAKYNKYLNLNDKNKRLSNGYSLSLWGYNVPNMFEYEKSKVEKVSPDDIIIHKDEQIHQIDTFLNNIEESVDQAILNDDILGLYKIKLDCCTNESGSSYINARLSHIRESILESYGEYDYSEAIPQVVPYFTPGEMEDINPGEIPEFPQDMSYSKIISELMDKLDSCNDKEERERLESTLLSYGWNPSVSFTEENIKFARNRQLNWLEHNCVQIIDLSKINKGNNKTVISESTSQMKKLYKQDNIYPVYIVCSFTNTLFGKAIRFVKHSVYTHAGLSLDSNLQEILTFKLDSTYNGFHIESINKYIKIYDDAQIVVLALFVDNNTKNKLESVISYFANNRENTKYNIKNIFNILFNKAKPDDPKYLSLVCSQFVHTVLKMANINVLNKSSNLVIPQDLATLDQNPKVYKLFEGLAKEYNEKVVEGTIYQLLTKYKISDLRYSEMIQEVLNNFSIESLYHITENKEANRILEEMRELIELRAIITERKLPLKFTSKGDLVIRFLKSLEQEYQESHKLLSSYNNDNIEGIKHELAVLFYINTTIEKKIKKMKKDDKDYKPLLDLRARVLNDFKKYFKVVSSQDKDFNFGDYYKNSEFYDVNIVIDKDTIKVIGSAIKSLIK